ncbi:MAG: hypothetical protein ACM3UV_04265, partial [Nocardioidaceae bacterium]
PRGGGGRPPGGGPPRGAPPPPGRGGRAPHASRTGAQLLARALGAREVVLGLGALGALRRGGGARPWLAGAALCDATDLSLTLLLRDRLPRAGVALVAAMAGGGAALGAAAAASLDG